MSEDGVYIKDGYVYSSKRNKLQTRRPMATLKDIGRDDDAILDSVYGKQIKGIRSMFGLDGPNKRPVKRGIEPFWLEDPSVLITNFTLVPVIPMDTNQFFNVMTRLLIIVVILGFIIHPSNWKVTLSVFLFALGGIVLLWYLKRALD